MVLAGWHCATGNSWESTSLYTQTLQTQNPSTTAVTWRQCPDPPTPLIHKPHSSLSGSEPQIQRRHLTVMPWPLTPLLHRPGNPPSPQLQLHLYCHPLHCRAPVTSHFVHQMVPLRMPLPPRMVLAMMIPVWPSTTSLSCATNADTAADPHQPRPEGAAYPILLPAARDAHRDSPTPSQISPH